MRSGGAGFIELRYFVVNLPPAVVIGRPVMRWEGTSFFIVCSMRHSPHAMASGMCGDFTFRESCSRVELLRREPYDRADKAMIRLITPPGMLLTTALLVIYSAYAFRIGTIEDSWFLLAGGGLSIVACYGTAMLRRWSQYLVYALAAGFIVKLAVSVFGGISSGFFHFQFGSRAAALRSLLPSGLMALLSGVCCVLVYRHFNGASDIDGSLAGSRKD